MFCWAAFSTYNNPWLYEIASVVYLIHDSYFSLLFWRSLRTTNTHSRWSNHVLLWHQAAQINFSYWKKMIKYQVIEREKDLFRKRVFWLLQRSKWWRIQGPIFSENGLRIVVPSLTCIQRRTSISFDQQERIDWSNVSLFVLHWNAASRPEIYGQHNQHS